MGREELDPGEELEGSEELDGNDQLDGSEELERPSLRAARAQPGTRQHCTAPR